MDLQVGREVMGWWWVGRWMDGFTGGKGGDGVVVGGKVDGWIYRWEGR